MAPKLNIRELTVPQLREECRKQGLQLTGNKPELIDRLSRRSTAGPAGGKAGKSPLPTSLGAKPNAKAGGSSLRAQSYPVKLHSSAPKAKAPSAISGSPISNTLSAPLSPDASTKTPSASISGSPISNASPAPLSPGAKPKLQSTSKSGPPGRKTSPAPLCGAPRASTVFDTKADPGASGAVNQKIEPVSKPRNSQSTAQASREAERRRSTEGSIAKLPKAKARVSRSVAAGRIFCADSAPAQRRAILHHVTNLAVHADSSSQVPHGKGSEACNVPDNKSAPPHDAPAASGGPTTDDQVDSHESNVNQMRNRQLLYESSYAGYRVAEIDLPGYKRVLVEIDLPGYSKQQMDKDLKRHKGEDFARVLHVDSARDGRGVEIIVRPEHIVYRDELAAYREELGLPETSTSEASQVPHIIKIQRNVSSSEELIRRTYQDGSVVLAFTLPQ